MQPPSPFPPPPAGDSRRDFLKKALAATAAFAGPQVVVAATASAGTGDAAEIPWFRRIKRWGQTNITELDPVQYDIAWWRKHWQRTRTQGVVVNAGGIVAYYPTAVPFHHQAAYLGGRDLFGELCRAAHEDGLAVFARMDSSRAHEDCLKAHPDWFARDASDAPYRTGDLYYACVNSPYYSEHIPAILREVARLYHPEGFTDNSWSGLGRGSPCFCRNCEEKFRALTGEAIPRQRNWDDPLYRKWLEWNYQRRLEIWDEFNRITREAGGPHCIWVGMNSGSVAGQSQSFRDYKAICERTEMIMLDHQARSDSTGFQNNGEAGKLVHGLLGWEKLIPESMAMYQAGKPMFRLSSKPPAEAHLWMVEGFAGGLEPWWHHVGAYHEDRRMYRTAEPVYRWHEANEAFLEGRKPIASVGLVWTQKCFEFFGREDVESVVEWPWRGMMQALIRGRIPYLPIHADHIERDGAQLDLLVLPNLGAMSDGQVQAVRRFVGRGGGLLATGWSSLFNEFGDARADFALADLLGVHWPSGNQALSAARAAHSASENVHSYLRLHPELRRQVDGPHITDEPAINEARHPVLAGFEETDLLAFGGSLQPLSVASDAQVLMTFVPPLPVMPPEHCWMRQPKTDIPGLILRTAPNGARVAFLPADLDRRFGRENLPDHGDLLANLVRWVAKSDIPLELNGPGLLDCHLYRQAERLILHVINLTNAGSWRQPVHELIPVGPCEVKLKLPTEVNGTKVRSLVSGKPIRSTVANGLCNFQVPTILAHEVFVVG